MTGLAAALARWLDGQRWFAGKNRPVEGVSVVSAVEIVDEERRGGPRGILVIAEVRFSDGGPVQHYQIPLGLRRDLPPWLETEPITVLDGHSVYEATGDRELMSALLRLFADGREHRGIRFRAERPGALELASRAGLTVRANDSEQSNTSVVYGDRFILKLFRRIRVGTNPDLDVHLRIGDGAAGHLAPLMGSVAADTPLGPVTLGVLQSFAADAVDGWRLATEAARGAADRLGADVLAGLGSAVHTVHASLARSFGTGTLTAPGLARLRSGMVTRLDAAVAEAPVLAPYAPRLRELFSSLQSVPPGESLQRVHGDLHLGQVLWTGGRWLLIDFEGEPSAPIGERVAWRSPLQDVAGMLRSLDYAQGHAALSGGGGESGWAERAKAAFCRGYGGISGARRELLRAYELDKAVYEVVYETRNRPGWARIPLRSIRELTGAVDGLRGAR